MASLDQLLVLQEHDTTADSSAPPRSRCPSASSSSRDEQELASLERQTARCRAERDEVARAQKRLEDEVASVEAKVGRGQRASSTAARVTSPRELQALQDDESSLKRRQANVEDKVLEQMELAVPLDERARAARGPDASSWTRRRPTRRPA